MAQKLDNRPDENTQDNELDSGEIELRSGDSSNKANDSSLEAKGAAQEGGVPQSTIELKVGPMPSASEIEEGKNGDKLSSSDSKTEDGPQSSGGESASQLEQGGEAPVSDINDFGFSREGDNTAKLRKVFMSRHKGKIIGGGLIGGFFGGSLLLILSFLPLKLDFIMQNIQSQVFAGVEQVFETRAENLMNQYLFRKVLPQMDTCSRNNGVARLSTCSLGPFRNTNNSYANRLYETWRVSGVVDEVFLDQGIDFEYDPSPNAGTRRYTLLVSGNTYPLGDLDFADSNDFADFRRTMTRTEFSKLVNASIREKTAMHQIWKRRGLRKAARSWGVYRWAVGGRLGELRDTTNDVRLNTSNRVKMVIAERVIFPLSSKYGLFWFCLIDASCSDADKIRELRENRNISNLTDADIEELNNNLNSDDINDRRSGLANKIIVDTLQRLGFQRAAQLVSGPVGWVILGIVATDAINGLDEAVDSGQVDEFQRNISTASQVLAFGHFASVGDELKSGVNDEGEYITSEERGAYLSTFDNFESESKLWQGLFSSNRRVPATSTSHRVCEGGDPIPDDQLVCPEDQVDHKPQVSEILESEIAQTYFDWVGCPLASTNPALLNDGVSEICSNVFEPIVGFIAGFINTIGDAVGSVAQGLIEGAISRTRFKDDYDRLKAAAEDVVKRFITFATGKIFSFTATEDLQGGKAVDWSYGGAYGLREDFLAGGYEGEDGTDAYGLGFSEITEEEAAVFDAEVLDRQLAEFQQRSFSDRLFSYTDDSFIARIIISDQTPTSPQGVIALVQQIPNQLATIFNNTLGISAYAQGDLCSPSVRSGCYSALNNPLGYDRNGPSENDPYFASDTSIYTTEYCEEVYSTWQESYDPITDKYGVDNPCLREETITNALGARFTDENDAGLSSFGDSFVTRGGEAGETAGASVVGDPYTSSVDVDCAPQTVDLGIHEAYVSGNKVDMRLCGIPNLPSSSDESTPGTTHYIDGADGIGIVNSRVSGAAFAMIQAAINDGLSPRLISSFRTMTHQQALWEKYNRNTSIVAPPGTSSHQAGVALDFTGDRITGGGNCETRAIDLGNPVYEWLYMNAEDYNYEQYSAESWHWDMLPVANRCDSSEGPSNARFQ